MALIQFTEWLPDQVDFSVPGEKTATNVLPHINGYLPFPDFTTISSALGDICTGAFVATNSDGTQSFFAGTKHDLFKMNTGTGTWTNVSKSTGVYNGDRETIWSMCQFGNLVIATNYNDPVQVFNLTTNTTFTDLSGNPPKARVCGVIGNFVVLGDLYQDVDQGTAPNAIRWSGLNNATTWTTSATTQCDSQLLYNDSSNVVGIFNLPSYGCIIQNTSIWNMAYVGSPTIFQLQQVSNNRGALSIGAAVRFTDDIYFISQDGFYSTNGTTLQLIGFSKIDKFFNQDHDTSATKRIQSYVDPDHKTVVWAYPSKANPPVTTGNMSAMICYRIDLNKFSLALHEIEYLTGGLKLAYTVDTIDSAFNSVGLDQMSILVDDTSWATVLPEIGCFNGSHIFGIFNGSAKAAIIETKEQQFIETVKWIQTNLPGVISTLKTVRPLITGTPSLTIQVASRNEYSDAISYGTAQTENSIGCFDFRSTGRYHHIQLNIASSGWTVAFGLDVNYAPRGQR